MKLSEKDLGGARLRTSLDEGAINAYTNFKVLHISQNSRVCTCTTPRGCDVVVKAYAIAKLSDVEVKQIRRELQFLMDPKMRHPHIVRGLTAFQDVHALYLVQEHAKRGDLFEVAARFPHRQLPERVVVSKIVLPISKAVAFLHARGIIHRDIKPENIVVMADGTSKLCDFGLAIDTRCDVPVSRVGTLEYMAPEIVRLDRNLNEQDLRVLRQRGQAQYCAKVDVWALGCLAFEMLFGRSPFMPYSKAQTEDVELAILSGMPTFGARPPPVSKDAKIFLRGALARDVGGRPSAAGLLESAWLRPAPAGPATPARDDIVSTAPSGNLFSRTVSAPMRPSADQRSSCVARPRLEGDAAAADVSLGREGSATSFEDSAADPTAADAPMADDSAADDSAADDSGAEGLSGEGRCRAQAQSLDALESEPPGKGAMRRTTFGCSAAGALAALDLEEGARRKGRGLKPSRSLSVLTETRRRESAARDRGARATTYASEGRLLCKARASRRSVFTNNTTSGAAGSSESEQAACVAESAPCVSVAL